MRTRNRVVGGFAFSKPETRNPSFDNELRVYKPKQQLDVLYANTYIAPVVHYRLKTKLCHMQKTHFKDLLLAAITNSKLRPANLRFSTSGFRRLFLINTLRFSWFGDGSG